MIFSLAQLEASLHEMADMADAILAEGFRQDFTRAEKAGGELVTSVDIAVNDAEVGYLRRRGFAEGMIISEESGLPAVVADGCWLIDPLDGTREFAQKIPEFAFSAAWTEGGVVRAAVISNPVLGLRVWGVRGEDVQTRVNASHPSLAGVESVLVSRTEEKRGYFAGFPAGFGLRNMGSIALKLGLVAAGRSPAVISLAPKSSWDIAAGAGLVEMAGMFASDLEGEAFRFQRPKEKLMRGVFACGREDMLPLRDWARPRLRGEEGR